ncbi:MAG: TetR/AcrR family transcriptional regulator [Anaerolineae bacterium]|nr:TetR/AcrR family transcriptional regulator [Anaerolineae bacterium]
MSISQPSSDPKRVLTPKERRERNHAAMKVAILDAARQVMRAEGVAALNLQEVARRVGMRAPSLYTYFPSRAAIYEALFVMGICMYRERVERIVEQYSINREGIQAAFVNYMAFAQEYPELYQLVFERPVPGFVPSAEGIEEARKLVEVSYATFGGAIAHGEIVSSLSAEQTVDLLVAIMHGLTAMHMANEPDQPVGSGRFGSLIPAVVTLLQQAWQLK